MLRVGELQFVLGLVRLSRSCATLPVSDSLCCIQILAPSPLCVTFCSVLQGQSFGPITDRFFHCFHLPPYLLVVAPHLQQDELCPWMDLISG